MLKSTEKSDPYVDIPAGGRGGFDPVLGGEGISFFFSFFANAGIWLDPDKSFNLPEDTS